MPLSAAQNKIAKDPTRFRVCVAGRRFGKTHLAKNMLGMSDNPNQSEENKPLPWSDE